MELKEIVILLLAVAIAMVTEHHYDMNVFYYATYILLHGLNPYEVPERAPWIYSNPLTYPQWYAYPPFGLLVMALASLPFYLLGHFNTFTFRLATKLVLIGFFYILARRVKDRYRVLLNPLIFFVTAIHGMIDIIAATLFVESIIRMKGRSKYWPLFYGMALATKQTVWLTLPAVAGYALKNKMLREFALALALFLITLVPFFGKGFIEYVLTVHEDRPPTSLGYTGIPLMLVAGDMLSLHVASLIAPCYSKPVPHNGWGEIILTTLMLILVIYSAFVAYKGKLMKGLLIASLAFVLFSKVVSPQNLLLPLSIMILLDVPDKPIFFLSLLAMIVDLTMGTVFSVYGYLAEDVLNALGTSIVFIYREYMWARYLFDFIALVSLILYHLSVMALIYFLVKDKVGLKGFIVLYLAYVILALNSISFERNLSEGNMTHTSINSKGALIWVWINPKNGLKAGDYLDINYKTAYWDYTYPLILETVKWLKEHGFRYVVLVYSLDRDSMYYYMPWLYAFSKYNMTFAWAVVIPHNVEEYIHGYASYPPNINLSAVLEKAFKRTPLYINMKVHLIKKMLAKINISGVKTLAPCPLQYLTINGKAVIFLLGTNKTIVTKEYIAMPLPQNLTLVNDFWDGKVLWGTPITPNHTETVLDYLHKSK